MSSNLSHLVVAALTLPSGPCQGAWAQLDSPITSLQTQQLPRSTLSPHYSPTQALFYKAQEKKNGEVCNNSYNDDDTVAPAYLIPLQDANGEQAERYFRCYMRHYSSRLQKMHFNLTDIIHFTVFWMIFESLFLGDRRTSFTLTSIWKYNNPRCSTECWKTVRQPAGHSSPLWIRESLTAFFLLLFF